MLSTSQSDDQRQGKLSPEMEYGSILPPGRSLADHDCHHDQFIITAQESNLEGGSACATDLGVCCVGSCGENRW